ncbi:PAS domain-containing sensor histidine kinase [Vibrio neptunius]|uniref:PAS domain-containing sensor histidine kinase n=1 Tax=Vibrio neptunius TaxID=170651 RepID=UPI0019D22098|nr:ATP-binding protein [Vibrio neptunius]MBN3575826.1 sensor histidine kinase [Vibrio neptunius]
MAVPQRYGLFAVTLLLIGLIQIVSQEVVKQWKLESKQRHAEERFLGYIEEVRRTLRRFDYLPFLITKDQASVRFLRGEHQFYQQIQQQLIQLDKAANTKGWYVLTDRGGLKISSVQSRRMSSHSAKAIAAKIQQHRGVVSHVTTSPESSDYFIASPLYDGVTIIGIVAVQVDLTLLIDQWFSQGEAILAHHPNSQFFLSSNPLFSSTWFYQHFDSGAMIEYHRLYDGTRIETWQVKEQKYLVQSVVLDDLNWRLVYLTPLQSMLRSAHWISAGIIVGGVIITLLMVIRYQRHQKVRSQQRMQKLVEASEKRLNVMLSKTHVGLILIDESGDIQDINPMAKKYFSLSESMTRQIKLWQLFTSSGSDSPALELLKNFDQHAYLAEMTEVEILGQRSDGSCFPVMISLSALPWHERGYYLCTVIDISKRKRAEMALKQSNQRLQARVEERTKALDNAQQELIESSKMVALGRMSSAIVHELNQPLTGLRTLFSSNQLLLERGQTQLLKDNMSLAMTLFERMASMTRQLKSFAFQRLESPQPVSLNEALDEVLQVHQMRLDKVDLELQLETRELFVYGEEARLRHVLGNLVGNALDSMTETDFPRLQIEVESVSDEIEVRIIDNGCGVEQANLGRMFEPFYTSKKIGEGLGLGLAIAANNVRDMQGRLSGVNNVRRGMTFTLVLRKAG